MKKILLILSLTFIAVSISFGQAKKPTIMVVPSDNWCIQNGYFMEFDNQGTKVKIPNYKQALQENTEILLVISSINSMMSDRGFSPLTRPSGVAEVTFPASINQTKVKGWAKKPPPKIPFWVFRYSQI